MFAKSSTEKALAARSLRRLPNVQRTRHVRSGHLSTNYRGQISHMRPPQWRFSTTAKLSAYYRTITNSGLSQVECPESFISGVQTLTRRMSCLRTVLPMERQPWYAAGTAILDSQSGMDYSCIVILASVWTLYKNIHRRNSGSETHMLAGTGSRSWCLCSDCSADYTFSKLQLQPRGRRARRGSQGKHNSDHRHLFQPDDLDLSPLWEIKIAESTVTGKEKSVKEENPQDIGTTSAKESSQEETDDKVGKLELQLQETEEKVALLSVAAAKLY